MRGLNCCRRLLAPQEVRRPRRFYLGTPPSRRHWRASLAPEPARRWRAQGLAAASRPAFLALCVLLALPALGAEFQVEDRMVTVRTESFVAVIDELSLTRLENKLTGEIYADGAGPASPVAGTLPEMAGVGVYSLRPAVPLYHYAPSSRSTVEARQTEGGVSMTYTGLEARTGDGVDFAPDMVVRLEISVDAEDGGLVIATWAEGHIEPVHDIRDRGVAQVTILLPTLAQGLRLVLPVAGGVSFTSDDFPSEWSAKAPAKWRWPRDWEAAIFIGEGTKGSFGIWADEPDLDCGRQLALCRSEENWQAALAFETMDAIYDCDEVKGPRWRLNVFKGNWLAPARRYRDRMHAQWPEFREPSPGSWDDSVQVFVGGMPTDTETMAS